MTAPVIDPSFACTVGYDAEVPCVIMTWKGYATSREFREANERILGVLAERKASKLLGDIKEFVLIGADDQHWLSSNWIPRAVEAGLRTVALVTPVFYFNRVAVESVGRALDPEALILQHFDHRDAARAGGVRASLRRLAGCASPGGIEVTELVHRETLERSLRAKKVRKAGKIPPKLDVEAYLDWSQEGFLEALQDRIDEKDKPEKVQGGPYDRYILVVVTDEFTLNRHTVEAFLARATFRATMIDDVILGLSYHPSLDEGGGSCPVFWLPLVRW